MVILDGESLERTFLVRLEPAMVTFTFLVLLIVTSDWSLSLSLFC